MAVFLLILSFVLAALSAWYAVHVLDSGENPYGLWVVVQLFRRFWRTKRWKYLIAFVFQILAILFVIVSLVVVTIG